MLRINSTPWKAVRCNCDHYIANIRRECWCVQKHICRAGSHARFLGERFDAMFPAQREFARRVRVQSCRARQSKHVGAARAHVRIEGLRAAAMSRDVSNALHASCACTLDLIRAASCAHFRETRGSLMRRLCSATPALALCFARALLGRCSLRWRCTRLWLASTLSFSRSTLPRFRR